MKPFYSDPFEVSLNGATYSPGDVVEVPPSVAASWLPSGSIFGCR